MKVSLNTIKRYLDFELPPVDELVKRINEQLGQVEEVIDLGKKYNDAVIVKVIEAEQHPNADRLRVCTVDDGGVAHGVPRDENGYVQVVCGAPNARAGIMAVWLPPRATVPASFDEPEPFVLDARELRGVLSQGMLAASDELAIGSDHNGIVEIDETEWRPSDMALEPGASFAAVYGLDDTVIDIENKMFTHRPDCFGQLGVAREIAGILGQKFTSPDWYWQLPEFAKGSGLSLELFNEASDVVPRFMAVAVKNVTITPSPLWLQCELVRLGSKPINNVVDATNYVMLLTAQPTHAYDYDTLAGGKLGARMAREGETIALLNGKNYTLTPDDIVIADERGAIGLAGIMGGSATEVSSDTKNIVLEVATFDMYTLRKSSMRHGVFTDALTRFNKGQSPLQNDRVLNLLLQSITDMAAGEQASPVLDDRNAKTEGAYVDQSVYDSQVITDEFINKRLGSDLNVDDIATLLRNVEIAVHEEGGGLQVSAPYWRTDIELPEDVVEEVGRLYGFDLLPRELPQRAGAPASLNTTFVAKQRVRESLAKAGANEVLTYSFVHEKLLRNAGQDSEKAFRLGNALSPDLQYYRLSLVPSLLDKIHPNSKAGYDEFTLFEIGKAHHKDEFDDAGLPREFGRVAGVYASKNAAGDAPYFMAKRYAEQLLADFDVAEPIRFQPLGKFDYGSHDAFKQLAAPFDTERAAAVWLGEQLAGVVGEFVQSVARNFKLPTRAAGFELFISPFEKRATALPAYTPLSRFPSVRQDLSVKVDSGVSYADVAAIALQVTGSVDASMRITATPVSIYAGDNDSDQKTVTLRFEVTSTDHTLTDKEVSIIIDTVADRLAADIDAKRG